MKTQHLCLPALIVGGWFATVHSVGAQGTPLTTFTNPTPTLGGSFGYSMAAVGNDQMLIGTYLFSTNGTLLNTFTNPTPIAGDWFGYSVAGVGSDRVLIGTPHVNTVSTNSGSSYLFSTNGTLLTTFTNPTPAFSGSFGNSVAAVGNDRVLIGAPSDSIGALYAGAAYLFNTNGTLLTTFTNPTPATGDGFGYSVAGVGAGCVLIGAYGDDIGATDAGIAYLFSTAGTLLTTFTKPTPAGGDYFGWSVAALGSDRVLIGAPNDDTGVIDAGAAYLFSINGTLLTTFTNPARAFQDCFGYSVASVGIDRVLIGAFWNDTGATDSGAAYLFSTNGILLTTFTNPTPALADFFGYSVATVGSDRVLIGAYGDDMGGGNAGAAYLFVAPAVPAFTITQQPVTQTVAAGITARFTAYASGFFLPALLWQYSADNGTTWSNLLDGAGFTGTTTTELQISGTTTNQSGYQFRLTATNSAGYAVSAAAKLIVTTGVTPTLLTTFTNPTPAYGDVFGYSVAAVGNDRVLIGAYLDDTGAIDSGAVYLFSTNGTLLTTFTNPTPKYGDYFGTRIATLGNDWVLIGAPGQSTRSTSSGSAYLFSTNGTLLTTFTNPTPAAYDNFGRSVAAVGNDRVLIGAPYDDTGAIDSGAVYLFSTNGTMLTTFTNPTPATYDRFGYSMAVMVNDRLLIGAPGNDTGATNAGAAYLFSTNGTLLTTFTNPTPATDDLFGYSMTVMENDRLLIGAPGDDTGATNAGAAYLFNTNGTLLTTFTNPIPATNDGFGNSVAVVGNDLVLIGEPQTLFGTPSASAAYLFRTNGTWLATFSNPTSATGTGFGYSVKALGNDRVLIGAYGDGTGAPYAGAAYLFSLNISFPPLHVTHNGTDVSISWITDEVGLVLQETGLLGTPTMWNDTRQPVTTTGTTNVVRQTIGNTNRFYHLRRP